MNEILSNAMKQNLNTLSEYEGKLFLRHAGIPIVREKLARTQEEAVHFADEFGYPIVLKGCSPKLLHKTEKGMVKLNLHTSRDVARAYDEIMYKDDIGLDGVLVQEQVQGARELVMGLIRDVQFGPCVMFGLGGIYTEVLKDTVFRVAPLSTQDAESMLSELRSKDILDKFRGSPAVDRSLLVQSLVQLGTLAFQHPEIAEIDINPLIVHGSEPIAVDALVVLNSRS